jgi:hypothetical protein
MWESNTQALSNKNMYPELDLDAPFDEFVKQLQNNPWTPIELIKARDGLQQRIAQIMRQIATADEGRGPSWRTSVETAKRYFKKKLQKVTEVLEAGPTEAARKKPSGHGFLLTFIIDGQHHVMASKKNPSDLWAELIADATPDSSPPALVAFLNLSEESAKRVPEHLWIDDL